ncbi:hypothetical protein [Streptomyces endophytica]|uniref:Uncharacterized protein n=1 Tax=Streptomyces endophytica TaxID=2991496 RepID=A0ABY6PEL3_9ACTN|nr:hypothetical protein [Streptomyces endophytica]UZJ32206.1 hypothetical protein OJ254_20430 [Streptomyces endophytica]
MSTDADFVDPRHVPPIPPRPPRQPATAATPEPDDDPRTTVLRRQSPADPPVPPQAPPGVPPRPATPPPPAPAQPPAAGAPRPPHPPTPSAPAAPPRPPGHPATFRDTAAFHLANSQNLWNGPQEPAARPAPTPPPGGPAAAPQQPWPTTRRPSPGVVPGPASARRFPAGRRPAGRVLAAAACLVLGIGLLGGAAAGSWLTDDPEDAPPTAQATFAKGRDAWRNTPVDTLFPRTVEGLGVGPGGADRTWTRIAVAPDSDCTGAYDPKLAQALARAGCARLLRATYLDATRSSVITVGAQTTRTDPAGMLALNTGFSTKSLADRTDLMPVPYAPKGTPAEGFGRAQRASWTLRVLTDVPVIVYAVSGFADGRAVTEPQPAEAAVRPGTTTAPAESGLGHDAKDLADRIENDFRTAAGTPTQHREDAP